MGVKTERPEDPSAFHILDQSPDTMSRLISYHSGKGYAASWVHIQRAVTEGEDKDGNYQTYDPPKIETMEELVIVSSDGQLFSDAPIPNAKPLSKTGLSVHLGDLPATNVRWSGAGVNRMIGGEVPDAVSVFEEIRTVVDHYMDFHGSFTDQETLCDLMACWIISTYFLDVIPVTGYLWPNGEPGSGKSHLLYIISTMAYLGQVITAGGSFAAIRDMAGYGGTLLFDDAEKIMDTKTGDPDKQSLLLAGNRKGTTVPLKIPTANKGWETRHINAFCPKAFSAIRLPIDTLASRTIFIPLLASDNSEKANSDPLDFDNWPDGIDRRRLVDDLWSMALINLGGMALADRRVARQTAMAGRAFQPWRAILSVASWLDGKGADGIHQKMVNAAEAYRNDAHLSNNTNQSAIVMRALRRIVDAKLLNSPHADSVIFATKDLHASVNAIARELDLCGDDQEFINGNSLGWRLKRMRLDRPDSRNPTAREWKITLAQLEKAERARGIPPSDKTSQTTEASETSQDPDVSDVPDKNDVSSEGDTIPAYEETF